MVWWFFHRVCSISIMNSQPGFLGKLKGSLTSLGTWLQVVASPRAATSQHQDKAPQLTLQLLGALLQAGMQHQVGPALKPVLFVLC